MSDRSYIKHLIECNCVLQIFKQMAEPPFHQFPVFSELDGPQQTFVPHFAVCPNCGAVHKVVEVGVSKQQRKETAPTLKSKEEIAMNLPDKLVAILEKNECDITIYQEAEFIIDHELWGKPLILHKEREGDGYVGKSVTILGTTLMKVNNFTYTNEATYDDEEEI